MVRSDMKNILFYKYVTIENIEAFRDEHYSLCEKLGLKGKVLVSIEGINGCLSGREDAIRGYRDAMHLDERFSDLTFKEGDVEEHTFRKLFVKIRDEIITSKFGVSAKEAAPYVEPKELKSWLESNEEVVLIDARNDYETRVGKFKGAIDPNLKTFQEWRDVPEKFAHLKDKKVVTYCTGGIRCEKASAYLKSQGFSNVYQLHGGILTYGKECGEDHWEGQCFVFDGRGEVALDEKKYNGALAEEIKEKRERRGEFPEEKIGVVTNYFRKSGIVEIKTQKALEPGMTLVIRGKTTQKIAHTIDRFELHEDNLITFPFPLVRKKDIVYL